MKFIALVVAMLAATGIAIGQPAVGQSRVVAYETLAQMCAANNAQSGTIAIVKGQTAVADADGFALYYDRASIATANGSNIFAPTNNIGRWFRISGFGGGGIYLNSTSDIRAVETSTLLATVDSTAITNVLTLGRAVKGDMGGGRYFFVLGGPISHVNNATVWRNGNNDGNWYYDLVQAKNGLNALLFEGVLNTGGPACVDAGLTSAFSFCLNPTYGSIAFQTNVFTGPYSSNRFAKLPLAFPPGIYTIGTVTNPGISMFGSVAAGAGYEGFTNAIVKFQKSPTNNSPMIVLNRLGATIQGITFGGLREINMTGHQVVTGWSSRTNFTYSGGDPDPISSYDRAAFFFDATGSNYLGCGLLDSVGSGTATLAQDEDLFSSATTLPANDAILVKFAPVVDINGSTGAGSSLAGPPAILIYGEPGAGENDTIIRDCFIDNFHSGIVIYGDSVGPIRNLKILNTTITHYSWAGISSAFLIGLTSVQLDNCYLDGFYVHDSNGEDPNNSYTNKFLRNGRFGVYGTSGDVQIGSLSVRNSHTSLAAGRGGLQVHSLLAGEFSRESVRFRKWSSIDPFVTNNTQVTISSLSCIAPFTGSESFNTWTLNTNATAIRVDSSFSVYVGAIHVPVLDADNQALPTVYRMQNGKLHISSTVLAENITSFRSALDTVCATTGDLPQQMTKAERNNITAPPTGILIYQTDATPGVRRYSNGGWVRFTETADP